MKLAEKYLSMFESKEEDMLPYGYKTFTGAVLSKEQVDAYNSQTKKINQYLKQGRKPPENLLNGRHNLLNSFSNSK